jgi:hypothetical protein
MKRSPRRPTFALLWFASGCALHSAACARCSSEERQASDDTQEITSPFDPQRPSDPLAPPPDRFPIGEWGVTDDYRMRVVRVETCDVEPYFAPREGYEKIGAYVEIEGRTSKEVPANVLHASLTDAANQSYGPTPAGCRPTLSAGRVTTGTRASGFVSFEIPQKAGGLLLHYEPVILGRSGEPLHFDLGR